jgi:hypothetical protein
MQTFRTRNVFPLSRVAVTVVSLPVPTIEARVRVGRAADAGANGVATFGK